LGKAAALILPYCNTIAMNLHLAEIAEAIEPGVHAVLLVDQAGWHLSHRLIVPPNMSIVPMLPKCPELNPVKNIWQYMQGNWLSNHVFLSYTNVVDHCCDAWNKRIAQPWAIMSVGLRDWAHGF
jgi:putative transposase